MSVKVAVRVRPFNQRQRFLSCSLCVQMEPGLTILKDLKKQHKFVCDYSFWSHDGFQENQVGYYLPTNKKYADQNKVFQQLGFQLIKNSWQGYNCCLFAYGQTGAGKSYSMLGYGSNKGIIPLSCQQIFQRIDKQTIKSKKQFEVSVSMLEIYNEKIQDLFINTNKRTNIGLKIRQNKTLGVYVEGLKKHPARSYQQMEKRMDQGSKNRSLASNLMNQYSSRAHTIVLLQLIQKDFISTTKMNKKTSLIYLVDLAGSQRVSKTGIENKDRLKQSSQINKSLHTLGRVIQALSDVLRGKSSQIPYRQSALTRILQNTLGGNSKTTMLCTISPASDNFQQTLSTLKFADLTKKIKNKPTVNQNAVDKLIRQLRQENQRLKDILQKNNSNNTTVSMDQFQQGIVQANIKQVQKQLRKTLKSFAINTDFNQQPQQNNMLMDQFIDLQTTNFFSTQLSFDFDNPLNCQGYITNLNQDQILNYKVKYSCDPQITIGSNKVIATNKVILCGLGIEDHHARIYKSLKGQKRYFIEALTQQAAEYCFLNGEPVNAGIPRQLQHNDRIILGINCVFLFKHVDKQPRKGCPQQKYLTHQFALTERQDKCDDFNYSFNNSQNISRINQKQALEMTQKLQEIQKQFQVLLQENQKKNIQRELKYKNQLARIEEEKRNQRKIWEQQLRKKNQEAAVLRKQKQNMEKLRQLIIQQRQLKQQPPKPKKSLKKFQSLDCNIKIQGNENNKIQTIHTETIIQNNYHHYHQISSNPPNYSLEKVNLKEQGLKNTWNQYLQDQIIIQNNNQSYQEHDQSLLVGFQQNTNLKNYQIKPLMKDVSSNTNQAEEIQSKKKEKQIKGISQSDDQNYLVKILAIDRQTNNQIANAQLKIECQNGNNYNQYNNSNNSNNNQQDNGKKGNQYDNSNNNEKTDNDNLLDSQNSHSRKQSNELKQYLNINQNQSIQNSRDSYRKVSLDLSDASDSEYVKQSVPNLGLSMLDNFSFRQEQLTLKIQQLQKKLQQIQNSKRQKQLQNKETLQKLQQIKKQTVATLTSYINSQQQKPLIKSNSSQFSQILQNSLIQCNNQNILNQRNLHIKKRKKQIDQMRKLLIKKQRIQLQKQMIILIPMVEKFNLMARQMNRAIQANIEIQYKNYSHYQIIQALRNTGFKSKITLVICVRNAEEKRSYKWSIDVFKNRFEIVLQIFEKYIENPNANLFPSKLDDPFWQPHQFQTIATGYLSLQCLLYQLPYQGIIKIISKGKVIGQLKVYLKPSLKNPLKQNEIINPRNLLERDIFFQIGIQSFQPSSQFSSSIRRYYISYQLYQANYRSVIYTTNQKSIDDLQIKYKYKHSFQDISQNTLSYLADFPLCFKFNALYTLDQQSQTKIRKQSTTIINQFSSGQIDSDSPQKFKKSPNSGVIFENNQIINKIQQQYKRQTEKNKPQMKKSQKTNKIDKKKQQKECIIY